MSNQLITIGIDLTKVDKSTIVESNGKKFLNLVVTKRREPDQYGNTHTVYIQQSKEERQAKAPKQYVGSGKEYVFSPSGSPAAGKEDDFSDDLPF